MVYLPLSNQLQCNLADLVVGLLENDKVMDGLSKTVGVLTGVFTTSIWNTYNQPQDLLSIL
jgi:hypothetical protein